MTPKLTALGCTLLSLHSYARQVLGNFTSQDQSAWPVVIRNRDAGNKKVKGVKRHM